MKAKTTIIILLVIAAGLILFFVVRNQETKAPPVLVGLNAPELTVSDISGRNYSLSDLKGSVVFVNFWATWCQPCREEIPSVQALYNQFKEGTGFHMVTILYRDDYQRAMGYMKQNNYGFPVFLDNSGKTARSYGVTGVPETYVVDKKGILREKIIGPLDWSSPEAVSRISELLKE